MASTVPLTTRSDKAGPLPRNRAEASPPIHFGTLLEVQRAASSALLAPHSIFQYSDGRYRISPELSTSRIDQGDPHQGGRRQRK